MVYFYLLVERIFCLSSLLEKGFYECSYVICLCLLVVLSGESVFFFGSLGIVKSLIVWCLKFVFQNVCVFEYLMICFFMLEEVFGFFFIQVLKDEGCYECLISGYLLEVEIVFLDEIWKVGLVIFNILFIVINECQFCNGVYVEKILMCLLVVVFNELLEVDSSLEVLYDCMLICLWLDKVQDKVNFRFMLIS